METLMNIYSALSFIDPVKVVGYSLTSGIDAIRAINPALMSSVEFHADIPRIGVEGGQGSFILILGSQIDE